MTMSNLDALSGSVEKQSLLVEESVFVFLFICAII